jgi:hypothetical protein
VEGKEEEEEGKLEGEEVVVEKEDWLCAEALLLPRGYASRGHY